MVGDTLHTDILGGNKFGLDTALVLNRKSACRKIMKTGSSHPAYLLPISAKQLLLNEII